MQTAFWAAAAAAAILWPARLAGPLDGAPLDQPSEVLIIGLLLPWLVITHRRFLSRRLPRAAIVGLLLWKAVTAVTLAQDGWCVQFVTPEPLYRDMGVVPHTWDVRADWRRASPACSAVMVRAYPSLEQFPVWFYNLPPANLDVAEPSDRPPEVRLGMTVTGFLDVRQPGRLRVSSGRDVQVRTRVDASDRTVDAGASGVSIGPGLHHVTIEGELSGSDWSLAPSWNDRDVWSAATATIAAPSRVDRWVRPWGRFVPATLVAGLALAWLVAVAGAIRHTGAMVLAVCASAFMAAVAWAATGGGLRWAPLLLFVPAAFTLPRRLRNLTGAKVLIGGPWLAFFAVACAAQAGVVTFYSAGDDWWMFQRFAYRIFMQGYWLEGGQPTFWFQPLYRWIAGGLHMLFGDSSAGELIWDAFCVLSGALFAFATARTFAGFRWGVVAAATTLAVFTLGPAWYLFGRGLSELSSAGFIYAAALFALRGRGGHAPFILLAGVCAVLAFYTRMNNLIMVFALVGFALPIRQAVSGAFRPSVWIARASRPVVAGILGSLAMGLWLFAARTYYYTGIPNMLHGTQAGTLSVWRTTAEGLTPLQAATGSLLMVLSMNDPPHFDIRAIPVMAGVAAGLLGMVGVPPFRRLPLNVTVLCLAGLAGALVARGTAYPGRFSVQLIPAAVALLVCAAALVAGSLRTHREQPPR